MTSNNRVIVDGESFLAQVASTFNPDHEILIRAKQSMEVLEAYSRFALTKIIIPSQILPQFEKLKNAIANIPAETDINRYQIIAKYPELKPHVELLERCLKSYPEILRGETHYASILFPIGDIDYNKETYDNSEADYINKVISEIVLEYINLANKKIRILEVGGGMGTCTRFLLPALVDKNYEYYFTDLGSAFVRRAQKTFHKFSNVIYATYNVEQELPSEFGNFDVVIGVNVLHATSDMDVTLKNMRNAVKKGGILVLNEITRRSDHATLTAGITSGWWLYKDQYRIPDSPLISIENWYKILKQNQFEHIKSYNSFSSSMILST